MAVDIGVLDGAMLFFSGLEAACGWVRWGWLRGMFFVSDFGEKKKFVVGWVLWSELVFL